MVKAIIIFLFLIMANFCIVVLVIVVLRPLKLNSCVVLTLKYDACIKFQLPGVSFRASLRLKVGRHKLRICGKSRMVFKNSHHYAYCVAE